jgi:hypothetical protein
VLWPPSSGSDRRQRLKTFKGFSKAKGSTGCFRRFDVFLFSSMERNVFVLL